MYTKWLIFDNMTSLKLIITCMYGLGTQSADKKILTPDAATELEFPSLSAEDLQRLTFSIYQMRQAKCYANQHHSDDGTCAILIFRETRDFLGPCVASRHCGSKAHHAPGG